MAATATTSHTSLPSHSGPIVFITALRPASSLLMTPWTAPTPRSKPSSTKNPVHSTAMRMNHRVGRVMGRLGSFSVGQGGGDARPVRRGLLLRRGQLSARVPRHQQPGDQGQSEGDQEEPGEADDDLAPADGRRPPVPRKLDALDDPRLPPVLG